MSKMYKKEQQCTYLYIHHYDNNYPIIIIIIDTSSAVYDDDCNNDDGSPGPARGIASTSGGLLAYQSSRTLLVRARSATIPGAILAVSAY